MIFVFYTTQGEATRMLMFCHVGHALKPIASNASTKRKNVGTENVTSMPNDCVVNVTQTQGLQSQSVRLARVGKGVKGMDQAEDEQLSPLQFQTHQMEDKTICHILGWKETGKCTEWASITHLDSTTKAY